MSDDVSRLGRILGIWAHPDDETFMVGGMLSMAAKNGQAVACVTATRGESGVQDSVRWPAETLAETRTNELLHALEIIGVPQHKWLDYPDGGCAMVAADEAVGRLVEIIDVFKPDTIITFPPDGLTGHDDHVAVSSWALAAAQRADCRPTVWYAVHTEELYQSSFQKIDEAMNVYFNIDMPKFVPESQCDVVVDLEDTVLNTKLQALKAMPSQYDAFFAGISEMDAALAFETEGLVRASRWAGL